MSKLKTVQFLFQLKKMISLIEVNGVCTGRLLIIWFLGVTEGFSKNLEIKGVGYKAIVKDGFLNLSLGYSHDIKMEIPQEITVNVVKATTIELSSYDKEKLGLFASNIKKLRLPEPYKGKGVRYLGEFIIRKEGKK